MAFQKFPVGKVINQFSGNIGPVDSTYQKVVIQYPSRINTMALDPSRIEERADHTYNAGEIIITLELFKTISINKNQSQSDSITSSRPSLVLHALELMRKALKTEDYFDVVIDDPNSYKHCGLGSSSSLISGVMCAINQLYGSPITAKDLVAYSARNHGEETGDDKFLTPVQCLGGSAVAGLYDGGVSVLVGNNRVIYSGDLNCDHVVIGIPKYYKPLNSDLLMILEQEAMPKFVNTGNLYREKIAFQVLHDVIPGLIESESKPLKDLIFNYRFNYGSIKNCSFGCPEIVEISDNLRHLYTSDEVSVLGLSSVGPAFFAVTNNPDYVRGVFEEQDLKCIQTKVYNGKFKVDSLV
ncbi:MAG: hypothetical protein ACRCXZ_09105 [Patescibacteria group bacterium]